MLPLRQIKMEKKKRFYVIRHLSSSDVNGLPTSGRSPPQVSLATNSAHEPFQAQRERIILIRLDKSGNQNSGAKTSKYADILSTGATTLSRYSLSLCPG